jgi:hypothetical protein
MPHARPSNYLPFDHQKTAILITTQFSPVPYYFPSLMSKCYPQQQQQQQPALQAMFFLKHETQNFPPTQNKRQNNGFCILLLGVWTLGWKT